MTKQELEQLELLCRIAEEDDSPMTAWEQDFLFSLDERHEENLSERQADVFDKLVRKHLTEL